MLKALAQGLYAAAIVVAILYICSKAFEAGERGDARRRFFRTFGFGVLLMLQVAALQAQENVNGVERVPNDTVPSYMLVEIMTDSMPGGSPTGLGWTVCSDHNDPVTFLNAQRLSEADSLLTVEVRAHERRHRQQLGRDGDCNATLKHVLADKRFFIEMEVEASCAGYQSAYDWDEQEARVHRLLEALFNFGGSAEDLNNWANQYCQHLKQARAPAVTLPGWEPDGGKP